MRVGIDALQGFHRLAAKGYSSDPAAPERCFSPAIAFEAPMTRIPTTPACALSRVAEPGGGIAAGGPKEAQAFIRGQSGARAKVAKAGDIRGGQATERKRRR